MIISQLGFIRYATCDIDCAVSSARAVTAALLMRGNAATQ
jgi:hypothetical protein